MAYTELRESLISKLSARTDTAPGDERFYHGRLISERLEVPEVTWGSTASPSEDMRECPSWLTAAEFSDRPASLEVKLTALLDLLNSSRHTVIFAGAGVSTSAGVRQRARADPSRTVRDQRRTEAVPTITHLTLTSLVKHDLAQEVVYLNPDGLLQKAGCPQEKVNEVYGSWFDPSNPPVRSGGSIRQDLWRRLCLSCDRADLCLVVGTSLSGSQAEVLVERCSRSGLGIVIVNLQQTRLDGAASLRIFSQSDRLMKLLTERLQLRYSPPKLSEKMMTHGLIPYDKDGIRSERFYTCLDLTRGSEIRLRREDSGQGGEGRVLGYCLLQRGWKLSVGGVGMLLGHWWMSDAVRGGPSSLPVTNIRTRSQDSLGQGQDWRIRCRCRVM